MCNLHLQSLLFTQEVATLFNVKPCTLDAWRVRKIINLPYIKFGKLVLYREKDVVAFVQKHLHHPVKKQRS